MRNNLTASIGSVLHIALAGCSEMFSLQISIRAIYQCMESSSYTLKHVKAGPQGHHYTCGSRMRNKTWTNFFPLIITVICLSNVELSSSTERRQRGSAGAVPAGEQLWQQAPASRSPAAQRMDHGLMPGEPLGRMLLALDILVDFLTFSHAYLCQLNSAMFTTKKQVLLTVPVDVIFPPPYECGIQGTGALLAVLHLSTCREPWRQRERQARSMRVWFMLVSMAMQPHSKGKPHKVFPQRRDPLLQLLAGSTGWPSLQLPSVLSDGKHEHSNPGGAPSARAQNGGGAVRLSGCPLPNTESQGRESHAEPVGWAAHQGNTTPYLPVVLPKLPQRIVPFSWSFLTSRFGCVAYNTSVSKRFQSARLSLGLQTAPELVFNRFSESKQANKEYVRKLVETDQLSMKLAFLAAYSHRQEAQLRLSRTTSIPEQRFGQKGQFEASQTEEVNGFSGIHY
ncbi:hypothetical protein Anapl_12344 [Anas platyrhynchos]|uniref:Uncharacterized protein n=1 Tax=Anas platyrhynchos TaxID=8839 RepID=R0K4A6_ANAPL|nr:hypothetical protein Anapl_12344 [Anas platyrhynchos]